ncbi:J domain-containing protein [Halomarina rubra]|uniref:J domain-containing protein n=1 Tax=Halomarina rubra TaxID=2071873 RepID=A0ABD6APX1_9EURY
MNRSSVAIALAGVLAVGALLFACLGLLRPLFWVAAAGSGASSYLCWRYGRDRILAEAYGDADPRAADDTDERRQRRVATEDWHRGGFEYRTGDASPSDDDWDDWRWPGAFWREDAARRSGSGTDGPTAGRTRTGFDPDGADVGGRDHGGRWDDPWADEDPNWWGGWAEETGESWSGGRGTDRGPSDGGTADGRTGREDAGHGETGETGHGGDRGRTRGSGQRQLSRAREEAAAVLGVAPDAAPETVRAAYRERVKETHPDCGGDESAFRRVRWAYEQLRGP